MGTVFPSMRKRTKASMAYGAHQRSLPGCLCTKVGTKYVCPIGAGKVQRPMFGSLLLILLSSCMKTMMRFCSTAGSLRVATIWKDFISDKFLRVSLKACSLNDQDVMVHRAICHLLQYKVFAECPYRVDVPELELAVTARVVLA